MVTVGIIAVLCVVADRLTKNFALILKDGSSRTFIKNVIDFVYLENRGAAFGIMQNARAVFIVITVAVLAGVASYIFVKKPKNKLLLSSLGLIAGGAVGNLIDRIMQGYVVDFIETTFMDFPVFNVADICVCIGVALLILYMLFFDGKQKN